LYLGVVEEVEPVLLYRVLVQELEAVEAVVHSVV
jgi:hypothetical protein